MLATLGATAWLYVVAPKGLFPQQDTGLIIGVAKAAPDISFDAMAERIQRLGHIVMADPDVDNVYYWIGEAGTLSQGRMLINLKPFADRDATATQVMTRLKQKVAGVEGIALYMQVRQDIQVGGRISATQYQYTLQDADVAELDKWSGLILDKLAILAGTAGRHVGCAGLSHQRHAADRPRHRVAAWHHRPGDRRRALRCVRPAADRHAVHAAQSIPRGGGSRT